MMANVRSALFSLSYKRGGPCQLQCSTIAMTTQGPSPNNRTNLFGVVVKELNLDYPNKSTKQIIESFNSAYLN